MNQRLVLAVCAGLCVFCGRERALCLSVSGLCERQPIRFGCD